MPVLNYTLNWFHVTCVWQLEYCFLALPFLLGNYMLKASAIWHFRPSVATLVIPYPEGLYLYVMTSVVWCSIPLLIHSAAAYQSRRLTLGLDALLHTTFVYGHPSPNVSNDLAYRWGFMGRVNYANSIRYFAYFSASWIHTLAIEYHVYIWQMSPQLSCGDTCKIWMWFLKNLPCTFARSKSLLTENGALVIPNLIHFFTLLLHCIACSWQLCSRTVYVILQLVGTKWCEIHINMLNQNDIKLNIIHFLQNRCFHYGFCLWLVMFFVCIPQGFLWCLLPHTCVTLASKMWFRSCINIVEYFL